MFERFIYLFIFKDSQFWSHLLWVLVACLKYFSFLIGFFNFGHVYVDDGHMFVFLRLYCSFCVTHYFDTLTHFCKLFCRPQQKNE
jgi:hypothetical protein